MQSVVLEGTSSDPSEGVPQGIVLAPLHVIIHMLYE